MKTSETYRELASKLPAGFCMDYTEAEYIGNENIFYPSATKMIDKKGEHFYGFLRIYIDSNLCFDLYDGSKGKKVGRSTPKFETVLSKLEAFNNR